jgi:hypothetical protein
LLEWGPTSFGTALYWACASTTQKFTYTREAWVSKRKPEHVGRNIYESYHSLPWGTSRELNHSHGHGINEVFHFRATGMIFQRLPLHLMEFEGIWGQYFAIGSE